MGYLLSVVTFFASVVVNNYHAPSGPTPNKTENGNEIRKNTTFVGN